MTVRSGGLIVLGLLLRAGSDRRAGPAVVYVYGDPARPRPHPLPVSCRAGNLAPRAGAR